MRARRMVGGVVCLVGALWIGQGVGWVGGSFMTGQAIWAVIGAVVFVVGVALLRTPRRGARRDNE
jgi:peptidoglycan/LPS O-acetylase OafA/YrhL